MTRSIDMEAGANSNITDSLNACGISSEDYRDLIDALYMAAPKEPAAHADVKFDRKDTPISTTLVSRIFDGAILTAEERGAVYAVWVRKIDKERGTKEVVGFAQFAWGQK